MSAHFDRALLLFEQSRYDLAERELTQELAVDPDNSMAHSLLALCLSKRKEYQRATEEAQTAVGLMPDLAFAHYALASVYDDRDRLKEAQSAIAEAIQLEPDNADYLALQSSISLQRGHWQAALDAAERGLEADAEHVGCNNFRALALVKLGREEEAGATIAQTLATDPDNPITHANQGWAYLEQSEPDKALEHFREALRLDPNSEWARAGVVEALKARNVFYRLMLRYFLWMSKFSSAAQWGIVLLIFFGQRALRGLAKADPRLAPFIIPLLIVIGLFILSTWLAVPFFNLLLSFNRDGRLALSRDQLVGARSIGAWMGLAILTLLAGLLIPSGLVIIAGFCLGLLLFPLAGVFGCEPGWPRLAMGGYLLVLFLAMIGFLVSLATDSPLLGTFGAVFGIGIFVSGFVGNWLGSARVKH
jgi:tetratricopeptide (TPR) repeat protein